MFSPKVLYKLPCMDKILMTLFVKALDDLRSSTGSCAEIMNCSFKTNCRKQVSTRSCTAPP